MDLSSLNKLYGKCTKVEKPSVVSVSQERSDDDKEVEVVSAHNKNYYNDVM